MTKTKKEKLKLKGNFNVHFSFDIAGYICQSYFEGVSFFCYIAIEAKINFDAVQVEIVL